MRNEPASGSEIDPDSVVAVTRNRVDPNQISRPFDGGPYGALVLKSPDAASERQEIDHVLRVDST